MNNAIKNMEKYLDKEMGGLKLPKKAATPFENDYVPEMDATPEPNPATATFYQAQVGVLQWIVELGWIDLITEASLLASQMALPREGHLDALVRTFAYLKLKHNSRIIFDPTYPSID